MSRIGCSFRPLEIPFASWEMFLMRVACAVLFFVTLPQTVVLDEMQKPHGLGRMVNLTILAEPGLWPALRVAVIPFLIAYAAGVVPLLSLSCPLIALVALGTQENSQGAINQTRQLLALTLLAQIAMSTWDAACDYRRKGGLGWLDSIPRQRRIIHAARIMIAAAYLTAAISKLDRSEGRWLWETPYLAVQLVKNQANELSNTGTPENPFLAQTLPGWIAEHPMLARLFFSPGLFLELFLFLGLMGRVWSAAMGFGAIVLHVCISIFMSLDFFAHEVLLLIFFVNLPYWVVAMVQALSPSHRLNVP